MTAYDPTNPKHVAIARRTAKAIADSNAEFIRDIMGMAAGRTYVYGLLLDCGHFNDTVFATDALQTAFNCGRQFIGQQIVSNIMACCPDSYVLMMREANARDLTDDTRRSRSDEDSNRDDSGSEPYVHPAFDPPTGQAGRSADGEPREQLYDYDPTIRDTEDRDQA